MFYSFSNISSISSKKLSLLIIFFTSFKFVERYVAYSLIIKFLSRGSIEYTESIKRAIIKVATHDIIPYHD